MTHIFGESQRYIVNLFLLFKKIKKRIPLARDQMPPKSKTLGVVFNNGGIETNTFSGATTKTKG